MPTRRRNFKTGVRRAPRLALIAIAAQLAVPGLPQSSRAADDANATIRNLAQAAYFSDTCRRQAEQLGLPQSADATFLIAAFAERVRSGTPDTRAEQRASAYAASTESARCGLPAISLINLLRLDGIDADLVLVSPESLARELPSPPAKGLDHKSVLVFVPTLDHYIDPAQIDVRRQAETDRAIKGETERMHLVGPSLRPGDPAACHDLCMSMHSPRRDGEAVRVHVETIHAPR